MCFAEGEGPGEDLGSGLWASHYVDALYDVLIDLDGWTRDNRLAAAALRPCEVQITFLGTPASSGAGFMDYVITDPVVVPDEKDDAWPEYPYLRQGVRVHGWVLLDQVPLGYEVWRRMNGFPPALKSKDEAKPNKPPKVKV